MNECFNFESLSTDELRQLAKEAQQTLEGRIWAERKKDWQVVVATLQNYMIKHGSISINVHDELIGTYNIQDEIVTTGMVGEINL